MRHARFCAAFCAALFSLAGCSSDPPEGSGVGDGEQLGKPDGGRTSNRDASNDARGTNSKPDSGRGPGGGTCDKLELIAEPNSPEILIVLDRSTSMMLAAPPRWQPSANAVKSLTSGLDETVRFGLMLYPASGGDACAPGTVNVAPMTGAAQMIASAIDSTPPALFPIGSTPTATTLQGALTALNPGVPCADQCKLPPQYVILVTDGQPTCGANNSINTDQADITESHAALDALREEGVKTFVIGYGTSADPGLAPVMQGFAEHGGTERAFAVENESELVAQLTTIVGGLVPCEYELSEDIEDARFIRVQIDGVTYELDKDWHIDGKKIVLEPSADACTTLRDAKVHVIEITKECEPIFIQ